MEINCSGKLTELFYKKCYRPRKKKQIFDCLTVFLNFLNTLENFPAIFEILSLIQSAECEKLTCFCDYAQVLLAPKVMAIGNFVFLTVFLSLFFFLKTTLPNQSDIVFSIKITDCVNFFCISGCILFFTQKLRFSEMSNNRFFDYLFGLSR